MTDARLLLATPPRDDLDRIAAQLPAALATGLVACVRLDLPGASEVEIRRAADRLRPICHDADTALVIREHFRLVRSLGLDGAEVDFRAVPVKRVREELGKDAVVGVFCGASRHDGMTAAEAGADYVRFGPLTLDAAPGADETADEDLFRWWGEMIETPVVAEGGVDAERAKTLAPFADFLSPDASVWDGDLAAALRALAADLPPLA